MTDLRSSIELLATEWEHRARGMADAASMSQGETWRRIDAVATMMDEMSGELFQLLWDADDQQPDELPAAPAPAPAPTVKSDARGWFAAPGLADIAYRVGLGGVEDMGVDEMVQIDINGLIKFEGRTMFEADDETGDVFVTTIGGHTRRFGLPGEHRLASYVLTSPDHYANNRTIWEWIITDPNAGIARRVIELYTEGKAT